MGEVNKAREVSSMPVAPTGTVAVIAQARWSGFRLSKQFIALAFAELGWHALYVDPPLSPMSVVRHSESVADLLAPRSERHSERLSIWRPVAIPGQNARLGQRSNAGHLARGILRRLGQPDLTVAFSLESRATLPRLDGRSIYHCTDSDGDLPGADAELIRRYVREIASIAGTVTACSVPLVEQLRERGIRATYVPHGCDSESLAAAVPAAELEHLPRPLLGYVGSVNFRVDPALLGAALDSAHEVSGSGTLVLIGGSFGPRAPASLASLLGRRHVVRLPQQSPKALRSYMAALDIALVPYSAHPFNRKSFPIKIPQYLGAGLPVVSTPNGATDELGRHLYVAEGTDGFAAAVARALEDDTPQLHQERRQAALARPWSQVAEDLVAAACGGEPSLGEQP